MASVYKHSSGKSPYWVAVFSDETGRQRHRSTKTRNREQAVAVAERYQRMAAQLRLARGKRGETAVPGSGLILETFIEASKKAMSGKFSSTDARKCLDRLLESTGSLAMASVGVGEFLLGWLETRRLSVAPGTWKSYEEKVVGFLDFLKMQGVETLDAVTSRHVELYRDGLLKEGISPTTVNLKVKMVSTAFRHAQKLGYISPNPFDAMDPLPAANAEREAFSLMDLRKLLAAAEADWKGMILVGACTGSRIGDAAALLWNQIDLKRGTITYFPQKQRVKEGARKHEAVILPDLNAYLLERRRGLPKVLPSAPVFPGLHGRKTGGKTGLSLTFRALLDRAGVGYDTLRTPKEGSSGRRVYSLGFHSLRHSCTSLMANTGVPEEIRKKLVGHTSDVHQRYTHFDLETFHKSLAKFPKLLGGGTEKKGRGGGKRKSR
jgi:integrase